MPDSLVPRNERKRRLDGPIALDGMEVRVAHAARRDLDENFSIARLGNRNVFYSKRAAKLVHDRRHHHSRHDFLRICR
jgi:hypothetical protein